MLPGNHMLNKPFSSTGFPLKVSGIPKSLYIEKTWGYELIHTNDELYCMKELYIRPRKFTSMHLHLRKRETLLVTEGHLKLEYIHNKKREFLLLLKGASVLFEPGFPHRLINEDPNCMLVIVEASTTSYDEDSIRID